MRSSERNPLDLNNLPEEYSREGKQVYGESSTFGAEASDITGYRKKRMGGKNEKEDNEKVYECRFCSLKFCKSQALGGHMNRHRQERETETLNRARQLVFGNENQGPHLGLRDPILSGGAQPILPGNFPQSTNMGGDPSSLPYRSVYTTRIFSGSPSTVSPPIPPPQPYLYTSSSRLVSFPSSHYPPQAMNDYVVGHVLAGNSHRYPNYTGGADNSNCTCIGTPLGQGAQQEHGGNRGPDSSVSGGGDGSVLQNQEDGGLNWGRSYTDTHQRLDPSLMNRFQGGF